MPTLTNYHWDPVDDCVLMETDQSGNTTATYTHEPGPFGPVLSENRSGAEYYHHYDPLGSTTLLTNDSGSVTDTFQYDAWGNSVARVGSTGTPYQWVGRWGYQTDSPTGCRYVRARSYLPFVARWASVDPLVFVRMQYAYVYCANRPVGKRDSSGFVEDCCCCCVESATITAARHTERSDVNPDVTLWGHKFTHVATLMNKIHPTARGKCKMEWFECSTSVTAGMREKNIDADEWFDSHSTFRDITETTQEWVDYETGNYKPPCPGQFKRTSVDTPMIGSGSSRVLWFIIKISSDPNCDCGIKSIAKLRTQILISDEVGNRDVWKFESGLDSYEPGLLPNCSRTWFSYV